MAKRKKRVQQVPEAVRPTDIKIVVATDRKCPLPYGDIYLPVHAGHAVADVALGLKGDDTGDNISAKYPLYGPLTAAWWAWKNLQGDALGLVPCQWQFLSAQADGFTRIFFVVGVLGSGAKRTSLLTDGEAQALLLKAPVIVPPKRRYFIESVEQHYVHAHGQNDLDLVREALKSAAPEYLPAFERCMQQSSGHLFNMFVMRKDLFDSYCSWLFNILAICEELVQQQGKTPAPGLYAALGEHLLDTWLETGTTSFVEQPAVYMKRQFWPAKIAKFLWRKLTYRPAVTQAAKS